MEFIYDNNYESSIKITLYEVSYGRKYRTPFCWTKLREDKLVRPNLIRHVKKKAKIIKKRLKAAIKRHKSYTNLKRKDIEYWWMIKFFLKFP